MNNIKLVRGVFFLIVSLMLNACDSPFMPKNQRVYTKGEVIKIWYHKSGSVKVKYKDKQNNEHLGFYAAKIEKLQLGEKYWIAYNKNDLEKIDVFYTAPIIEDSSQYVLGKGHVIWNLIREYFNSNDCRFVYNYKGIKYKRYQKLVDKEVLKGDKLDILINKLKPEIAYVKGNSAITK